jgi:subtilisin family serine protease
LAPHFKICIWWLIVLCSLTFGAVIPIKAQSSIDPNIQWNLIDVGAIKAWNYTQGSPNIVVAVIDSGIDFSHPDLTNQSWANPGEIPDNNIDDDNNGYIDDIIGWDFRGNDNDPSPGHVHGTFVAGLIAADNDNDIIIGIAPNIRLMAIRFLDDGNAFGPQDWGMFINALQYAVDNGARIIHLSIQANGIPPDSFQTAIKRAYEKGVVIISVTGNNQQNLGNVTYPGNYSEVIAVSAVNQNHERAYFSLTGDQNEICAPGEDVFSILPNNIIPKSDSGTSFAAPLVTGTIALMLSLNNSLPIETIRTILHETSTDLGPAGKDSDYGYGLLNASAALERVYTNYYNASDNSNNTSLTTTQFQTTNDISIYDFTTYIIVFVALYSIKSKRLRNN